MLKNIRLEKILFLDIETVPQFEHWENLSAEEQLLWDKKTLFQRKEESAEDFYPQRAGILSEFGKIVCISVGMVSQQTGKLRIHSFYGHDEAKFLQAFAETFANPRMKDVLLCAHNGKEFDFPYIARRMIINGIEPPPPFRMFGKKPWEIPHLDTMELWKFGDWKHYTSLALLAHVFGIPTPKDDIDGSMVAQVYYQENDLERIRIYCEKDVLTLCHVFQKLRLQDIPETE